MTDLYRVLGVSRRATDSELKSAYRRLARKYHPDVSSSPDANAAFARISEAYRILGDPERRARYDRGESVPLRGPVYTARAAETAAYQRQFDKVVDEMIARERQEAAERSHAVTIVVTLFLSAFFVALAKPMIIEDLGILGRVLTIALSAVGGWYLVKNLAAVLARYTYDMPAHFTSVFRAEVPSDKLISRRAALVFLVSGYFVFLGLGHVISIAIIGADGFSGALVGMFLYPPIAVLFMGNFRKIGLLLDKKI